ncbi:MAG TPA: hypothetical protein VFD56_01765 [Chitinophagaceae bacterium]|nr:hypothetical protein [Chitinophagaceae bacterium]
MKQFLVYSLLFIAACGNNNTATESQTNNSTAEKKAEPSTHSAQSDEIVGEWEMVGSVMDTNDNLQIDEAERKNLKPAAFKDYMKLNNDGSGLFTVAKMEGRYEATAKESGDKKFLTWHDKANGPHRIGTIISVSKSELHIKEPGGHGLFIWKRL